MDQLSQAGEDVLFIKMRRYNSKDDMQYGVFEKDGSEVICYSKGGYLHYIMSNLSQFTAVWMVDNTTMCYIYGDVTLEEMEKIIDSIYGE